MAATTAQMARLDQARKVYYRLVRQIPPEPQWDMSEARRQELRAEHEAMPRTFTRDLNAARDAYVAAYLAVHPEVDPADWVATLP